jgi:hypothetical protein
LDIRKAVQFWFLSPFVEFENNSVIQYKAVYSIHFLFFYKDKFHFDDRVYKSLANLVLLYAWL